ncbi:MAG: hypothetical protein HYV25_03070 [Candidatus Harrisonbacteria bacterium]|nr:hypothetical protein [Candidatus Harrisonbacteria bacterium]
MKVGDEIIFSLTTDPAQKMRTEVLELLPFPTFQALYAAFSPKQYGGSNADEWEHMYKYYSKLDEERYGVLAIKFRLIEVK